MKVINIKFNINLSNGGCAGTCGQTDRQTYRKKEMTKVIRAFRSEVPKSDWNMYTISRSSECERKVLQRKEFARRHAFCKLTGIQASVFQLFQ